MTDTPDVRLGNWQAVGLVAGREIKLKVRSKAFIAVTGVTLVLLVGFSLLMKLISGGSDATVGLTGPTTALEQPLKATASTIGHTVDTRSVANEADGRAELAAGNLDALLVPSGDTFVVVVQQDLDGSLEDVFNVLAGQLAFNNAITDLGGDPSAVNETVARARVEVLPIEPPQEYDGQQLVIGMVAGVLIYMSLLLNGQMVATGVVEEKSSRVVELLLATIRPWQLMAGKVLGIGVIGLAQMAVIGGVGIGAALAFDVLTISLSTAVGTVVWLVVWFLLGFLVYSLLFAALAALVSRQEDVGGVITPPLMFVILGYVVGISVLPADPGNKLVETLSLIPVFSPTLMPMRLAMGGVPAWQAIMAVVLTIALIPALVWLSGRVYRNAVMRSGARVKLMDALKPV
ncbi:ABC transporter permease [Actinokineospora fastidiosa]|uniref:ABC transporter permease n=1 Tax=Actinokineospora fastidiosa TaxID=1816 RepID=A0A918G212_9PSEU|nr:ABC transporter permease [Actinokineospora fastidiosa]GGS15134.1 ABC transporter permease [Actinokineospora fastidiosa]